MLFDTFTSALIRMLVAPFHSCPAITHFVQSLDHVREQVLVGAHARSLFLGTARTQVCLLIQSRMDIEYAYRMHVLQLSYV